MTTVVTNYSTAGQAARLAGITRKALRVYESHGLLTARTRTPSGYRLFAPDEVEILRFIRRAKSLGLSLTEIREVLALQRSGLQPCNHVVDLLDTHLAQIEIQIGELERLRNTLHAARSAAEEVARAGGDALVCRIIEHVSADRGPSECG